MKIERGKGRESLPSFAPGPSRQVDEDELHVRPVVQEGRRGATGVVVVQDDQDDPEESVRAPVRVRRGVPDREVRRAVRRPHVVRRTVEVRFTESEELRSSDAALRDGPVQVVVDVDRLPGRGAPPTWTGAPRPGWSRPPFSSRSPMSVPYEAVPSTFELPEKFTEPWPGVI